MTNFILTHITARQVAIIGPFQVLAYQISLFKRIRFQIFGNAARRILMQGRSLTRQLVFERPLPLLLEVVFEVDTIDIGLLDLHLVMVAATSFGMPNYRASMSLFVALVDEFYYSEMS